jgi:hypothetical protein
MEGGAMIKAASEVKAGEKVIAATIPAEVEAQIRAFGFGVLHLSVIGGDGTQWVVSRRIVAGPFGERVCVGLRQRWA